MSGAAGLIARSLHVSRAGRAVLHDVSLHVAPGEIVTLLGANGAGKSSLVMTVAGALPATSGEIRADGASLTGLAPSRVRRSGVAVVAEGHRVLGQLSVRENIEVGCMVLPASETRAQVAAMLELFPELEALMGQRAGTLSGGQKQMVALAQGLVARPRYLLVDELSLGLAPVVVKRLAAALRDIAATGVGVLLVEQFTAVALSLASRAYVMALGRMVYEGPAGRLADDPEILHRAYLGQAAESAEG